MPTVAPVSDKPQNGTDKVSIAAQTAASIAENLNEIARVLHPSDPIKRLEFISDVFAGTVIAVILSYTDDNGGIGILGLNAVGRITMRLMQTIDLKAMEKLHPPTEVRQ